MRSIKILSIAILCCISTFSSTAQIDEDQLGAWYMYFFSYDIKDSRLGFQGDIQHRNWDAGSDLEQLLLRGGVTYRPKNSDIKFTLGAGNITTGAFGSNNSTVNETRIYQEALYPHKFGKRFHTTHRFRYEQRKVEGQDVRTRYRFNMFLNVGLNNHDLVAKTIYLALYNEIFINGERKIGDGNTVQIFDRNRFYSAVGYAIKKNVRVQVGFMRQSTDGWSKNQAQVSLHTSFK